MIFPVPYRITNRSNASLRQPGKYTKATGGNGGWDGNVSHQSFLEPKYPSLYGILCIFVYFHIFKERCSVFVCKGMSQSPTQNTFSKIFNSCKACRRKKFGSVSRMPYIRGRKTFSMSIAYCTCESEDWLCIQYGRLERAPTCSIFYGMQYEELPALTFCMPNQ